jgi:hypothetical protein
MGHTHLETSFGLAPNISSVTSTAYSFRIEALQDDFF